MLQFDFIGLWDILGFMLQLIQFWLIVQDQFLNDYSNYVGYFQVMMFLWFTLFALIRILYVYIIMLLIQLIYSIYDYYFNLISIHISQYRIAISYILIHYLYLIIQLFNFVLGLLVLGYMILCQGFWDICCYVGFVILIVFLFYLIYNSVHVFDLLIMNFIFGLFSIFVLNYDFYLQFLWFSRISIY